MPLRKRKRKTIIRLETNRRTPRELQRKGKNYKKRIPIKNKDKINERRKESRQKKIIEELGIDRINKIHERWIQFNKDEPGRHITENLSPKQKLKIMKTYNIEV